LYPIAKFALFELEKYAFSSILATFAICEKVIKWC
jgi:hypothetical protein